MNKDKENEQRFVFFAYAVTNPITMMIESCNAFFTDFAVLRPDGNVTNTFSTKSF